MKIYPHDTFEISYTELQDLKNLYPQLGKSSDVGKFAVEITKMYLTTNKKAIGFEKGENGADLKVLFSDRTVQYEIKGTASEKIAWTKLKVSSRRSYEALKNGMTLIRITNIGSKIMKIYFLNYATDFVLIPEERWAVLPIQNLEPPKNTSLPEADINVNIQ